MTSDAEKKAKQENSRPPAMLVCKSGQSSPSLEKFQAILQKLSALEVVSVARVEELQAEETSAIFLDAALWHESAPLAEENLVLLSGVDSPSVGLGKGNTSILDLSALNTADLVRAAQLALIPECKPGIACLSDSGSEIYYEKIHGLPEVGERVDRFVRLLEKAHPALLPRLFFLRQLSYAIFHQAFSGSVSKFDPAIDFQLTASQSRIALTARFSAPPGILAKWREQLAGGKDPVWAAARQSSDLLVLTELKRIQQLEIKAVMASDTPLGTSFLFRVVEDFLEDAVQAESRKAMKLLPFGSLKGSNLAHAQIPSEPESEVEDSEKSSAAGLNYKVRSEMLENENTNLQGLVKKKNHLLTGLNRDVNRAQRELALAKNTHTKELHKLRMEIESERNAAKKLKDELVRLKRKMAEERAGADEVGVNAQVEPSRDYEKDWKAASYAKRLAEEKVAELGKKAEIQEDLIQSLRKEALSAAGQINELKDKVFRLGRIAAERKSQNEAQSSGSQGGPANLGALPEKLKEAQRQQLQAKAKEQELEREIKRLKLQLESSENGWKAKVIQLEKQIESKDRQIEEAKRQKAEAFKKAEEEKKAG
jgi:hypothetical protein